MIEFYKFQGAGNDFIIFEESKINIGNYSELAKNVCDRHFGIGADGMIIVSKSETADIRMKFYNADGSIATMCGNGIRCFSKFVYENNIVNSKKFTVETLGGIMRAEVIAEDNKVNLVKINMGRPKFLSDELPKSKNNEYFINEDIIVDNKIFKISSLIIGTIHTVLFVDDFLEMNIERMGNIIENYKLFPKKTNVNFCKVIDKENIEVVTWEKGVGITLACGTGAAAAAIISMIVNNCNKKISVKVKGGNLLIEQIGTDVFMTGEAKLICKGEYNIIG